MNVFLILKYDSTAFQCRWSIRASHELLHRVPGADTGFRKGGGGGPGSY